MAAEKNLVPNSVWIEVRRAELEAGSRYLHQQNEAKKQQGEPVYQEVEIITKEFALNKLAKFIEARKIPQAVKERARGYLSSGKIGEAVECLALADSDRVVSKNARLPEIRRSLVAHSGEKRMAMNEPSPAFELGTVAHILTEIQDIKTLKQIITESGTGFREEGGRVVGIIYGKDENQYSFFPEMGEAVDFEEPLPLKQKDEEIDVWVKKIISEAMEVIGEMPTKPNDVEVLFKNEIKRAALVRIVEVGHFIFGNYGAMGVIEKVGETEVIRAEGISGFQAINWLSIATRIVKDGLAQKNEDGKRGTLVELSLGEIRLKTGLKEEGVENIRVPGGEIDVCELEIEGMKNLPEVVKMFEKRALRLRKPGGERLGRNMGTLLKLLSKDVGVEELIRKIRLSVTDYKFLIGDGKYHLALNKNLIPSDEHQKQVREYIFLIICQLYQLYKGEQNDKTQRVGRNLLIGQDQGIRENVITPIKIKEVIKFAKEFGLIERITGQLDYQIPGKNEIYKVKARDTGELKKWADEFLQNKLKTLPEHWRAKMLKLLQQALFPGESLEIYRRLKNRPTEEISRWCVEYRGNNYLILSELGKRLKSGELEIDRAVKYEDGVVAFWFLIPNPKSTNGEKIEIRVALNNQGHFRVTGLPDITGPVDGSVSSSWDLKVVMEEHQELWKLIERQLWTELVEKTKKWIDVTSRNPDGKMIDRDGILREVVPGKPIVCKYDHFTANIWVIDKVLLAQAAEEIERLALPDYWGQGRLANMIAGGEEGVIFCPNPFHDNQETEAASLYSGIIHCFVCGNVGLPDNPDKIIRNIPLTGGESPEDYQEVEAARNEAMGSFFRLTQNLARDEENNDFSLYLGSRGLEPTEVAEWCGYMPLRVSKFLHDVFYQAYVLTEKRADYSWEELESMNIREFLERTKVTELLNKMDRKAERPEWLEVKPGWFDELFNQITIKDLRKWDKFRLIGRDKEKNDLYGGRITFITQWINSERGALISNINGRGVEYRDDRGYKLQLYEGNVVHRKARTKERLKHNQEERVLRQTPPGFYIPDLEKFKERPIKKLIIMEGPITAASAWKLMPEWKDETLVMYGLLPKQILAILKWIGVTGYEAKNHPTLGKNIEEVVLALDFDWGGMHDFKIIRETLKNTFPNLRVTEVLELLKGTPLEKYARPHDISNDDEKKLYPQRSAGFGGGKKRDFNDILRMISGITEDDEEPIEDIYWEDILDEIKTHGPYPGQSRQGWKKICEQLETMTQDLF